MDATSFSDVPQDDCSFEDEWHPDDYHWNPYEMKATKIARHGSKSKRRGRTRVRGPLTCQVAGCPSDLGTLKEYHQRYKICPYHMKAKCIVRDGSQQRFCQQCGRFHQLQEFDGAKRSCRVRLAKHNRRRRKKTSEPLKRTGSARSSNLSQSNCPTDSNVAVDVEESLTEIETGPATVTSSFLPSHEQTPYLPKYVDTGYAGQVMYRKGQIPFAHEPLCNSPNNIPPKPDYDATNVITHSLTGAYRNFFGQEDPASLAQGIATNPNSNYSMPSEMSLSGSCPGLPLMMPLSSNVFSGNPLREPVAFIPPKSKQNNLAYSDPCQRNLSPYMLPGNACVANPNPSPLQPGDAESLVLARMIREESPGEETQAASYKCLLKLTSLSVKVFDCTPGNLPVGLRNELLHAVHSGLVPEGYMRPGCVHLIFDVIQPGCKKATPLDDVVSTLLSSQCCFWKKRDILIQADNTSILLSSGKLKERHSLESDIDLYPCVRSVHPTCVLNTATQQRFIIRGDNIDSMQSTSIHCRIQGKFVPAVVDDAHGEPRSLSFSLKDQIPCGALKLELSKNGMIDHTLSVLSVDDVNVVAEIESFHGLDGCELQEFLMELGLAVELRSWLNAMCVQYSVTPFSLGTFFRRSVRSDDCRFGFKNATPAEINCCVLSACHVFSYCRKNGLFHTAEYLQSIVTMTISSEIDRAPIKRINGIKPARKKKWRLRFMRLLSMKHQARRAVTCF